MDLARAIRLLEAEGVEMPRFEAQLLLAMALGVSRTTVLAGTYSKLTEAQQAEFGRLVAARSQRVPLAYLRGTQEFYGLEFRVTPAVLIPRPETELLVDFALEKLATPLSSFPPRNRGGECPPSSQPPSPQAQGERGEKPESSPPPRTGEGPGGRAIADIGTGSGCIAIAVLANCPESRGAAFDLSETALEVARDNATRHGVEGRLRLAQGDLLAGAQGPFDVIVSNPPYIPTGEIPTLQAEVRDYEPRRALEGGADGLALVRRLAREAMRCLAPGGWLGVELARGQAAHGLAILAESGFSGGEARRDLAGIERIVCGQKAIAER